MTKFDIRRRDGLARTGVLDTGTTSINLPAAAETETIFPALVTPTSVNMPLAAPANLAEEFPPAIPGGPVIIHPALKNTAQSGDCVLVTNWHTSFANPRNYVNWLVSLKEKTPADTAWYGPAAALPSTAAILCYSGFDLFDYTAVDLRSAQGIFCTPEGEFPATALGDGICTCPGCRAGDLREHNRQALRQELALITRFIRQAQLRDLVESRCRMDANQVAILRHLDRHYAFMEAAQPIARAVIMRANSGESMQRAEVQRFAERVLTRYIPPEKCDVAVLLPCSAKKPYSLSQSHRRFQAAIGGRAHELIITSPLGLVPRELECIYPAGHYDVPVTGYWDAEECAVLSNILARYFAKFPYRRIIAHLDGGALQVARQAAEACGITLEYSCAGDPAGPAALNALDAALAGERRIRDDRLHGMLSYQFGADVVTKGIVARGRFPELFYSRGNTQLFSIDTGTGLIRPTFDGWALLPECYRVTIDDFIPEGDVLVPGVTGADPAIREGDEVLVTGKRALATGRAALPAGEMHRSKRGVAVRVRKIKRL
ncbi:archaeosine synthase subunit alpha [Methanoregula sp.]|uniref:archaeosine synthase subunit alpha n=1 Tax=Methanoregula sp. TaxID=2052170 RepID=UPI00261F174F|nr:archaeosine synthase subunit alpha [Methanoregula sp.]MDD5141866.1 archaeosine synthase subunit alpha [Methanoregula sp.]